MAWVDGVQGGAGEDEAVFAAATARLLAGEPVREENPLFGLGAELLGEFLEAELLRHEAEDRWLSDLRQYKGRYEPEVEARIRGSRAFLRKTRVKVESVDARLMDLLFPANRERNWSVEATPEPSIAGPQRERVVAALRGANGGVEPEAEAVEAACVAFAQEAARRMSRRMEDQLTESRYRDVARRVLHSGNLYGTGVLKGPLVERRTRVSYVWSAERRGWVQEVAAFAAPFIAEVPLWRWYPDMAVVELSDARFVWEHHRLSRAKLVALGENASFDGERIRGHIRGNPEGCIEVRRYEEALREMGEHGRLVTSASMQYDVFERWGWLAGEKLLACGVQVPEGRLHESFFANVWVLPGGEVIKAVLAPIEGMAWPYHLYYFDKDETSIFGEGLASIMRDDQEMINAAVRMLLDNAAITAGPQFEVYVPAFSAEANLTDIYPHKVWPRTGGDFQFPAVRQLQFNSHMGEVAEIIRLFDANADETTAIPKFTYGDNPTRGAAGTMGGLSMLLGQANIALKDLVTSWDEGVTKPFIAALYRWNMRFGGDESIKGDFDVLARGASSLIAKEVKSGVLAQFGATLQPEERPFVKWEALVREKAAAMDIGDIVKSAEEVAQEAAAGPTPEAMAEQEALQGALRELELAGAQARVAEVQGRVAKAEAEAMGRKVEAVYAAMQAAGVALQAPGVVGGVEAIFEALGYEVPGVGLPGLAGERGGAGGSAGLGDSGGGGVGGGSGGGVRPVSPFVGQRRGIETEEVGDGASGF